MAFGTQECRFFSRCQAKSLHVGCVLAIGDEFCEGTVFCGTEEKIGKHVAQGVGDDEF
jgi:hypothetical protein